MGQFKMSGGETFDVSAHLSGPVPSVNLRQPLAAACIIVELEAASSEELPSSLVLDQLSEAAAVFGRCPSLASLCHKAAAEFRRITGFDRVMVYRFLDDDVGKVLAEDRREDMHSFLNHHFPASDIPRQARRLYLRNLIRVIPDITYEPALLRPDWNPSEPLDLSDSSLRSVSPVHLQYLANMNVRASASVSIVKDGVPWGLIACHNETPRSLSYGVRAACRALAGVLARQVNAKEEAQGYRQRIRLRGFEDDMVALLSREGSLEEALTTHLNELSRMMRSDGVAVLRGPELVMDGVCPSASEIRALADWLTTRSVQPILSTDHLSGLYPRATTGQRPAGHNPVGRRTMAPTLVSC
jgi:light-regulated signal transduction histidine kinase (bacteriophytochrome)